jgi:phosphatidylglycerophosphate synthase
VTRLDESVAASPTRRREIWTRLVIDPLAGPLGRSMARWPGVTPNRVTGLAALAALASAACFATGLLRVGGALFLLRFFFDVCDGVVARAQAASSARGAFLDVATDVAGISLCFGALGWYLVRDADLSPALPLAVLGAVVFYNWILAYRKALAGSLGLGDGGVMGNVSTQVPILRAWSALCVRLHMSPVPWAVEAETVALGLGPLLLPTRFVWIGFAVALAFYLLADLVNVRRVLRLTARADPTSEAR